MRILHTMIRVYDLERSIAFYTQVLGMKLLRQETYPEGRFSLAFVGYGEEARDTVIELTHNWDQKSGYNLGDGFGHIALGVSDIEKACQDISAQDGEIVRPPGPMKHGKTIIAFVKDPDGYFIELIETTD